METIKDQVYILSPVEMTVIAAGKGIKEMYTLQNKKPYINIENTFQALNNLYRHNLLQNVNGEFVLEKCLGSLINNISKAKIVIVLKNINDEEKSKIFYIQDKIVVLEKSVVDKDAIKIFEIEKAALREFLIGEIIEKDYIKILDEDNLVKKSMGVPHLLEYNDIRNLNNCIYIMEILNKNKSIVEERVMIKQGVETLEQLYYKDEKLIQEKYQLENYAQLIDNIIKEVFNDIS